MADKLCVSCKASKTMIEYRAAILTFCAARDPHIPTTSITHESTHELKAGQRQTTRRASYSGQVDKRSSSEAVMRFLGAIFAAAIAAASVVDAQAVQAEDSVRNSTTYSLFHRVVDPAAGGTKQPSWKSRGKLVIKHYNIPAPNTAYALQGGRAQGAKEGPGARSSPASPFGGELENLAEQSKWDELFLGKGRSAWYQLALVEGEPSAAQVGIGSSGDVEGPIAATKAVSAACLEENALFSHTDVSLFRQ
jgi:hypothetical protein